MRLACQYTNPSQYGMYYLYQRAVSMKTRLFLIMLCSAFLQTAMADAHVNAVTGAEQAVPRAVLEPGFAPALEITPQSGIFAGSISRAFFANGIEDREPKRVLNRIEDTRDTVYFFSELIDFADQVVSHRWIYKGSVEAEISFAVNGPRWRVWSSKLIPETQRGLWQVDIIDQANLIIESYPIMAH